MHRRNYQFEEQLDLYSSFLVSHYSLSACSSDQGVTIPLLVHCLQTSSFIILPQSCTSHHYSSFDMSAAALASKDLCSYLPNSLQRIQNWHFHYFDNLKKECLDVYITTFVKASIHYQNIFQNALISL
jgi:hypothetical protein